MDVAALPALVTFFLLLPGVVARRRFKRVERTTLDYSPFGQVMFEALIWATAWHALALLAVRLLTPYRPELDVVLGLLVSDAATQNHALQRLAQHPLATAAYFLGLTLLAYLVPAWLRALISQRRLDRIDAPLSRWLRFSEAPWYYLLSGADFTQDDAPDLIAISAIVNMAGQPMLYTGFLSRYFLTPDGNLDRLILQRAMRRPLAQDKAGHGSDDFTARFYAIDGDYFVLRYSEAITLNVQYIKLDPSAEALVEHGLL